MSFKDYLVPDESSLWKRNLLILSIAQFLTMIGMSATIPFLSLYVVELGITDPTEAKFWSGLVYGGLYVSAVVMIPFWGSMGDKYGRKLMAIRALFGLSIAVFLMSFATNVYQLFFLRMLQGALSGFLPAALAFVAADAPENRSGYAIGILQSSISAGTIIGPFVGGVIADTIGIRPVFYIVGALCLSAGFIVVAMLKERNFVPNKKAKSIFKNLSFLMSNKEMAKILLIVVIAQAGIQFTLPIFAFFVEGLNAPPEYLATITGLMFVIVGVLSVALAPYWGKRNDRKDWKKTIIVSSGMTGIFIIVQLFAPNYWYLYPLRAILGIFFAAIIPTLYSALSKRSPSDQKSGIMGIASGANLMGSFIGLTFSGMIASQFGIESTFWLSGILLMVCSIIVMKDKYGKFSFS